jgi:signal transduction histidine kinase
VAVQPIAQDLRGALLRAHASKDYLIELAVDADASFSGDANDLYEALGNVMENAAKWCRGHVKVTAFMRVRGDASRRLELSVDDDGPGIAPADRLRVMQRGARADELTPGHGLGLAMVSDMAQLYGGIVQLGESPLGGARITLDLPGR